MGEEGQGLEGQGGEEVCLHFPPLSFSLSAASSSSSLSFSSLLCVWCVSSTSPTHRTSHRLPPHKTPPPPPPLSLSLSLPIYICKTSFPTMPYCNNNNLSFMLSLKEGVQCRLKHVLPVGWGRMGRRSLLISHHLFPYCLFGTLLPFATHCTFPLPHFCLCQLPTHSHDPTVPLTPTSALNKKHGQCSVGSACRCLYEENSLLCLGLQTFSHLL